VRALRNVCLIFAIAASIPSARADDPAEPVRIDFRAPATCPSREAFLAGIRARTSRMQLAPTGSPARTFSVVLEDRASGGAGRVTIQDRDGRQLRRDVTGASCEEVADVLALVVALAIDPHATLAPRTPQSAPTASGSAQENAPSPSATPAPVAPTASAAPDAPPVHEEARQSIARDRASRTFFLAAGAGASGRSGVTPAVLFGSHVFVEARVATDTWSALRLRLSFERTASGMLDVDGGGARFTWTAARADTCVAGWRKGSASISPCFGAEAGTLEAAGSNIDHARGATRPWLAIGPLVRAAWRLVDPLYLAFDVSAHAALVRPQFFFEPNATVYDVPLFGAGAGLSLGAFF
jgi:hypothetical protein